MHINYAIMRQIFDEMIICVSLTIDFSRQPQSFCCCVILSSLPGALNNSIDIICRMPLWWTKIIASFHQYLKYLRKVQPLYPVYQAPSYEPFFTLLVWLLSKLAFFRHVVILLRWPALRIYANIVETDSGKMK